MSHLFHAVWLITWLMGCTVSAPEPECVDHTQCARGEACSQSFCIEVECLQSSECFLGQYCNTDAYVCQDGCTNDGDCETSDECVNGECQTRSCRTSHLDCPVGHECNPTTGECVIADNVCIECTRPNDCLSTQECLQFDVEAAFCWDVCSQDSDCPAGFFCREPLAGDPDIPTVCFADCVWLNDNLWL